MCWENEFKNKLKELGMRSSPAPNLYLDREVAPEPLIEDEPMTLSERLEALKMKLPLHYVANTLMTPHRPIQRALF